MKIFEAIIYLVTCLSLGILLICESYPICVEQVKILLNMKYFLANIVLFSGLVFVIISFTFVDDIYLYFRYRRNWKKGKGK